MVQDCVFAPSSEFQFGVWRRNGYNPGSAGSEFGERMGIILVRHLRSSEKGHLFSPSSEPWQELRTLAGWEFEVRTGMNPGLAGSEFGERPVPFSELRTLAGSVFEERSGQNLGSAGSDFIERTRPNPGSAGSEFGVL